MTATNAKTPNPAASGETAQQAAARATVDANLPARPVPVPAPLGDRLYRRFFLAAILFTLTAGTTWGAVLLFRIGQHGSFTALPLQEVNAHGHVQIFGWVGLFIMGFALQALPRFRQGTLWRPELANAGFWLMVVGILARATGGFAWQQPWALPLGVIGSMAELVAVGLFATVLAVSLRRAPGPSAPYEGYVAAAVGWLLIATVFAGTHFHATMTAPTSEALIRTVSVWQAPLREIQIAGVALLMILGVSQRFLSAMYGFPETPARRSGTVLVVLNGAILGSVVSHPWFLLTHDPAALALRGASGALLLAAVLWLVLPWRLWRMPAEADRSVKFVRAAFLWLLVALLMAAFVPVYNRLAGVSFSHAYFGAVRHAITVGFISMMILGVAAKVVPTLAGLDPRRLGRLWPTFWLVNLGCFLRVSLQVSTDHLPGSYAIIGLSAVLETAGIALWAAHLVRVMAAGRRLDLDPDALPRSSGDPPAVAATAATAAAPSAVPSTGS